MLSALCKGFCGVHRFDLAVLFTFHPPNWNNIARAWDNLIVLSYIKTSFYAVWETFYLFRFIAVPSLAFRSCPHFSFPFLPSTLIPSDFFFHIFYPGRHTIHTYYYKFFFHLRFCWMVYFLLIVFCSATVILWQIFSNMKHFTLGAGFCYCNFFVALFPVFVFFLLQRIA